jgi:hypothetical protein
LVLSFRTIYDDNNGGRIFKTPGEQRGNIEDQLLDVEKLGISAETRIVAGGSLVGHGVG